MLSNLQKSSLKIVREMALTKNKPRFNLLLSSAMLEKILF